MKDIQESWLTSIKTAISKGEITFFEGNGFIYCRDCSTDERILVGQTMKRNLEEVREGLKKPL